ncbi:M949_RS01915 family surface polysaccharide biosynthesis protein [Aquimarina pacifica]|uniref:M949_RS01915 family surface polysaccharide biosynthesis protein n=1 Tax=Aquimarina pacifica TaxID=1296415 RepID=UPI0004711B97|nr:hypothetical protein [Aquimarina pacifica]
MNKLLYLIVLLVLFSCQKQQKSKVDQTTSIANSPTADRASTRSSDHISGLLTEQEVNAIFTRGVKKQLDMRCAIHSAYKYKDSSSTNDQYLVLTEDRFNFKEENDTVYNFIKAFDLRYEDQQFKKRFTVEDEIDKEWETSIWFWTKYSEIADIDHDGKTDIILVYGTTGPDMFTDGKIKIVIFNAGKKTSIRHHNSELNDGRYTKIKKTFYTRSIEMQNAVKEKMRLMEQNGHARFPTNWQAQMDKKESRLGE